MIKVSVIIPVYNVEEYLEECLDSVVNQTLQEIEIISVNDGSTDGSLAILEKYAEQDNRIQIVTKENAGQGAARNVGVKIAGGEYLLFVDGDDYIALDTCETLYKLAKKDNLDIVQSRFVTFPEEIPLVERIPATLLGKTMSGVEFLQEMQNNVSASNCDKLWSREFFINNALFNPEGIYYEDVPTAYKGFLTAKRILCTDQVCYYYRTRPGSTMQSKMTPKHYESRKVLAEKIFHLLNTNQDGRRLFLDIYAYHLFFAVYHFYPRLSYLKKEFKAWLTPKEVQSLSVRSRIKLFLPVFLGKFIFDLLKILRKKTRLIILKSKSLRNEQNQYANTIY